MGSLALPIEQGISGLVVEYIVAIDVTRVRFPADANTFSRYMCVLYFNLCDELGMICQKHLRSDRRNQLPR